MSTRRTNISSSSSSSNAFNPEKQPTSEPPTKSDIRPAVPSSVLFKLLAFTFAMVVVPLGSYFFTVKFVFRNASYAGGFAAVMANVVLIAYIVVAMNEDEGDQSHPATGVDVLKHQVEGKKAQ